MIYGALLFALMLGLILLFRWIGKLLDLPEMPKESWILLSFCLGMVFLKVFQKLCIKEKSDLDKEIEKENKECGY